MCSLGLIENLMHVQVGRSGDTLQLRQNAVGESPARFDIVRHNLHIDRRGQAEIQNLADDVGGQEVEDVCPGIARGSCWRRMRT